ncbi:hypothetical protein ABGB17_36325 [Sphaerisporangium sp. B11E5]|uniref:hypothetical protein n=1 Tax=Sphaerisporangium sp. B11E5 TaxID=3153563 RepID=UPI00325E3A1D
MTAPDRSPDRPLGFIITVRTTGPISQSAQFGTTGFTGRPPAAANRPVTTRSTAAAVQAGARRR